MANVLAVAIWADGEYDDAEREAVTTIATDLGYTPMIFQKMVEGGVGGMLKSTDEKVNAILQDSAQKIIPSEKLQVYEAAIEIVLANSVIEHDEIDRLLAVAGALDIDIEEAVELILDMVNPDAEIEEEELVDTIASAGGDFDKLVDNVVELCDKIHDPETFAIIK